MKASASLVRTIFISMISIAVISILLLGILMVHNEYVNFNKESKELRERFLEGQKQSVRDEVNKAVDYIEYMKSGTEKALRNNLEARVGEAYEIAMNIYNENRNSRSLPEIEKMVKDALRPIRFNNGSGYYFATRLDGVEQLFSDRPDMEGRNLLGSQDSTGKYVIKDMIEIAKKSGEGFYEYTWTKPEQEGRDFPKLSYIKLFKPFNWLIGTGEYIDSAEKSVQGHILERISKIRFGRDGYIFVVTYDGVTVMNDTQKDLIGKNIWGLTDPNGVKVIQEERKAVENPEGGFISYVWNKPSESKATAKISFIKGIKDWKWMVGGGVYLDDIDIIIGDYRVALEQKVRKQVLKVVLLLLFLIASTYMTARYISRRINQSILIFSSFFQKAADESININLKEINFSEFEKLAASANTMVDSRIHAERSLRENEEKYRTLFHMESDALALVDAGTGNILDVNNSFIALFGYNREEILTMQESALSADQKEMNTELQENLGYGNAVYKKKKSGVLFPAEIIKKNFRYQGKDLNLLAVRDISDRKRLEAQLRQAQKMEAIGTLAGGIAHDFNNILLPIMGHAEMLMMGLPPESHIQYNLQQIYQAGNRAKDMVKQILAFSKKDRQERREVRLGEIINEAIKLLRATIPTTIDIRCAINSEDDGIFANSTQIHQVLLNLCTNAAHSMRDTGGVLRIEADKIFLDPEKAGKFHNLLSGGYLKVSVSDTGPGIDPAIIDKIFEPYFTTKGIGEGTGMGLAVAHGIILDHKGDIAVESEPGKGATFTILLPVHERSIDNKSVGADYSSEIKKGNEKILLVDDEELVIVVLKGMLEHLGYSVTSKTSSVDALDEFCNNPEKYDLIITDMTMPNMTGKELAVRLTAVNPNVPAILCTGFSEQVDEESSKTMGIKAFIMKPVEINQLAKTIREVLDREKGHGRS